MAEDDSFVDLLVRKSVGIGEFGAAAAQLLAMAALSVDCVVELLAERARMHHALLFVNILCVCRDVDDHRLVLRQWSFEVGLLPFKLFEFSVPLRRLLATTRAVCTRHEGLPPREPEVLQV